MLDKILEAKKYELDKLFKTKSLKNALKRKANNSVNIIAEVKRASPSKGDLNIDINVKQIVKDYEQGGAVAISVLTEEKYFKGSMADLREVAQNTHLPVLRKDFIIDEIQLFEARLNGADAVLLIVAALPPKRLHQLLIKAKELQLDALIEVHNLDELNTAMSVGAEIVGINNRDLTNFNVDIETTLNLAPSIPEEIVVVSESGIDRSNIGKINQARIDAALIGESLVTSKDRVNNLQKLVRGENYD